MDKLALKPEESPEISEETTRIEVCVCVMGTHGAESADHVLLHCQLQ